MSISDREAERLRTLLRGSEIPCSLGVAPRPDQNRLTPEQRKAIWSTDANAGAGWYGDEYPGDGVRRRPGLDHYDNKS